MDLLTKLSILPLGNYSPDVTTRRATWDESETIIRWVRDHFESSWADEITIGFNRYPIPIYIAIQSKKGIIVGFAAYECTSHGFFGPIGVDECFRGKGIGRILLLLCLKGLADLGYEYAIIHDTGDSTDFYKHILKNNVMEIKL
jgi:ribosomal protein S18 acetylase RimI-like enzyme